MLVLFGWLGLAGWLALRPARRMAILLPGRWWLAATSVAMAFWCWTHLVAPFSPVVTVSVDVRNIAMLIWLFVAFHPRFGGTRSLSITLIFALLIALSVVAAIAAATTLPWELALAQVQGLREPDVGQMIVQMLTASGGLLLVDQIVRSGDANRRTPLLVACGAMAALWAYDLNFFLIGALAGRPAATLIRLEPLLSLFLIPAFLLAAMDTGREKVRLSRTMTLRAILLIGLAAYLVVISLTGAFAKLVGRDYGELAQSLFLVGALGLGGLFFLSARARGWASVMVSKHFFEHRYDYRAEWMRFTATIGSSNEDAGDINRRVTRAIAELTGSQAAIMLLPDSKGDFHIGEQWRWPTALTVQEALPLRTCFMMQETGHIVDLDAARRGAGDEGDVVLPHWLRDETRAWVAVPMLHFGRMMAVVILHRPPNQRRLDWEDLDMLRIAGQQGASYLAESQGQQALSEARRFDEFNRRFAFIIHDVKNLASQLGLLAANAERHADNPEFRADMIDTLKLSVGRMGELLARLSPQRRSKAVASEPVALEPLLEGECAAARTRHLVLLGVDPQLSALGDGQAIRQIVGHLLTNAIDASPPHEPVQIVAAADGARVRIDILDRGKGMSKDFIREQLFKPFVSTKDGGFGLGAFEARELADAMGGSVEVVSEEGEGSGFTLWLPAVGAVAAMRGQQRSLRGQRT